MAISKADFNNINITPTASKAIKWNASANGFEAGALGGSIVLISTQTASGSATLSFTSGIDSTYKKYVFKFTDIHPAAVSYFSVNFSDDGGSSYDLAKTSTSFIAYHDEADSATRLTYRTGYDLAQGTGVQPLGGDTMGVTNDNCGAGHLDLYDPSSTTFVKHFISRFSPNYNASDGSTPYAHDGFTAGYINTTAAVTAVQFAMSTGNIDVGTIKMYGIT